METQPDTQPVWWKPRWKKLSGGNPLRRKPCLAVTLSGGNPVWWKPCLIETLSDGNPVWRKPCLMETLSDGNPVWWKPCVAETLYDWSLVWFRRKSGKGQTSSAIYIFCKRRTGQGKPAAKKRERGYKNLRKVGNSWETFFKYKPSKTNFVYSIC